MAKTVKILAATLFALIALLVIALFVITRVIDPNDFKTQISQAALDNANLDLAINGDLSWAFWPSLGVQVGSTEARIHNDEALFAGLEQVHIGVAVWPLLSGNVEMDTIHISGLKLNLIEGADGANWEQIGSAAQLPEKTTPTPADEPAHEQDGDNFDIPLSIAAITISDAYIHYRVVADGTDIIVEHANFSAQNVALDKPFPLQASLRYQDQNDIRIDTQISAILDMDLNANLFHLSSLLVDTEIGGMTALPVTVHSEMDIEAALNEDRVSVRNLLLDAAGTHTTGSVDINQLSGAMVFAGELHSAAFDANAALKAIGEAPIETTDPEALKNISLDATIGGPANGLILKPLTIKLDSSILTGMAGIEDIDSGKIVFDLHLDQLIADGYLPPSTTTEEPAPGAVASNAGAGILPPLSTEPLLPLATLRALLVDGKVSIGSLSMMDIHAAEMEFVVRAENGLIELTQAKGKALDGSFLANAQLDARTDIPTVSLTKTLTTVQLQPVVIMALDDDLFTGVLDMELTFNSSGNSEKSLVENARSNTTFHLADGTVRGANLHNTLVSGINDLLGSHQQLSALLPGQASGKLPMELSKDTKIINLDGKAHLEKEIAYVDTLNAELNKGAIKGNGVVNLRSQQFDLKLEMQAPQLTDNQYLKNQAWPIRCKGNLEGDPEDWCGHDKDGFKKIGKNIAAKAASNKVKERFGIEGEGDTVEEVVKDSAKKKAQEALQEKLNDKLKGLFQ